jgi:hypothetical protein
LGLPYGRLTGPRHRDPDPNGVSTFRTHEIRPGWVPSLPRGMRCPHGRHGIPGRRTPPFNGEVPGPRHINPPSGASFNEASTRVHALHPSGLLLACDPRMEREPLGFSPELHTPPLPATHVKVETGMLDTCLSYVTICWPSNLRSHSKRATSCRTPAGRSAYGAHMNRGVVAVVSLYICAAVGTRLAEAAGMRRCECSASCWCRRPFLSAFRWVVPVGHR